MAGLAVAGLGGGRRASACPKIFSRLHQAVQCTTPASGGANTGMLPGKCFRGRVGSARTLLRRRGSHGVPTRAGKAWSSCA